jgi:glutamate-1-semialdehyde 2,1-aminomutase
MENATGALAGNCLGMFKLPDDVAFTIARGAGALVWDTKGRQFYDYVMGSGPMALGHAHPRVVAAICEQAARGTHYYQVNERAQQLAERVCRLVPCAESVKFCSDGSEATFYALRLARAFTRRTRIVKFDGAFHGHHDYAKQVLKTGHGVNDRQTVPDSAGIPPEVSETVVIAPYNDLQGTSQLLAPIAHEIAAIIVEPVQRGFMPAPGFLEGLRALANKIGALLVFDEVVTGFRLALGGGQELFGVTPDLCALGKILGGGLPLAAVAGRRDVLELTIPGRPDDGRSVTMTGTLNGNPLACAAGLATLDVIEELAVPGILQHKGLALGRALKEAAHELSIPFLTIGAPAFQQAVFGQGPVENAEAHARTNLAAAHRFGIELVRRGVLVVPGSKLYMSVAHDDATHGAFLEAATGAMRAIRDQGLLN